MDSSGYLYITTGDTNNLLKIYTNRSGSWSINSKGNTCYSNNLDTLVIGTDLCIVLGSTSGNYMTIIKYDISTLQ